MATTFPPPSPPFIQARYRGGSQKPKAIVMHGTVSSDNPGKARQIARWWAGETSPKSSAHYVVDPTEVIQCVGDHTIAFHCGYNSGSIAIELCDEQAGPASRWQDADSRAILRRAARLTAELCLAYGIEARRPSIADLKRKGPHGIYGHNDSRLAFGRTSHTDPRDFDWDGYIEMVREEIAKIKAEAIGFTPPNPANDGDAPRPLVGNPTWFRAGTANIRSFPRMRIKNVELDMERLRAAGAHFWGLQEISPKSYMAKLKEVFPFPKWQMRRLNSGEAIVFDKERFTWLYAPKQATLLHEKVPYVCARRSINYVWVWDNVAKCSIDLMDIHLTPKKNSNKAAAKAHAEGLQNIRQAVIDHINHGDGRHVVIAGDWNCSAATIYAALGHEIDGMPVKVVHTGWGPHGVPIDHIVLVGHFKIGSRDNLTGQKSDHRPAWVNIMPI